MIDRVEVDYHSVRLDLLQNLPVLDVGAGPSFVFSKYFALRGHRVVAMDPDPSNTNPDILGVTYLRLALVGRNPGVRAFSMDPNPQARFVSPPANEVCTPPLKDPVMVEGVTILHVSEMVQVPVWDLVKLNCEGEESEILKSWPGPIARQIVVSFHEHYRPIGEDAIEKIMEHLDQWYLRERHVRDARYGGGMNYWDTLLVRR